MTKGIKIARSFGPASFYAKALKIALPVMAQMLIQNLVSLIDNFMVAGLGDINVLVGISLNKVHFTRNELK